MHYMDILENLLYQTGRLGVNFQPPKNTPDHPVMYPASTPLGHTGVSTLDQVVLSPGGGRGGYSGYF